VSLIVFYVSGHGLGHATRSAELIAEVLRRAPAVRVEVRTDAAPLAFARLRASPRVAIERCRADPGVVDLDPLTVDVRETARAAVAFYAGLDHRAAAEARYLRTRRAALVVADAPPLGVAAAARAGLPSVVVANFTWDWIYRSAGAFASLAPGVVDIVAKAYAGATLALRLPLGGGFESCANVRDVSFIARRSRRERGEVRRLIGIEEGRPAVLPSFGGGLLLPLDQVERSAIQVIRPERLGLTNPAASPARRTSLSSLRYEDLVLAADAVVSKPGYGIVSECAANRTPLLYAPRGPFAEYDVMVREMPRVLRCKAIGRPDLMAGRWAPHLDALLAQPAPADPPPCNGAAAAAEAILGLWRVAEAGP